MRMYRDSPRHEIRDVNVSTSLRGDFSAAHVAGDQARVLPTDSQKNTCFAFAKEQGVDQIEQYALDLARHFVDTSSRSRARASTSRRRPGSGSPSTASRTTTRSAVRCQQEVRTATATVEASGPGQRAWVVSGLQGPGGAEVDRVGVPRLPGRPLHDPAGDHRPRARDLAGRRVASTSATDVDWGAAWDGDVRRILCRAVRGGAQPRAPADAVVDGQRRARGRTRSSPRSACRRRTCTTSWPTCRRSASTTPARCTTPPTGPTG